MKVTTDKAAYPQPDRLYLKGDLVLVLPGPFSQGASGCVGILVAAPTEETEDGIFYPVKIVQPIVYADEIVLVHTSQIAGLQEAAIETVKARRLAELFDVR